MKLLLIGGYSHSNPGDEAILKATVYHLNGLFPSAGFSIWTALPDFKLDFDRPINHELIYWQPLPWMHKRTFVSRLFTKLYTDFYPFSRGFTRSALRGNGKFESALKNADKVILVGGGYLNSDNCLLEMNYLSSLAKTAGKPIYLLGQTLGPFRKDQHRKIANDIFQKAQKILLRDSRSDQEVSELKSKILYGVDDALSFDPKLSDKDKTAVDSYFASPKPLTFFLGINLRDWAGARQYYPSIARSIESFVRSFKDSHLKLIFIPMETSCHSDDRIEGEEFAKHLSPATDYAIVKEAFTAEQKFYLISRLDLLVGMRFHSLVFALASGVPAIGLYNNDYYFRKISGLFEPFEIEKNMLPLDHLEDLQRIIEITIFNRHALKKLLLERKTNIVKKQHSLTERMLNEK